MNLYNQLFQENKDADVLIGVLGLNKTIFERYRDIYLNKEGDKIIVYTRCGGGNRREYGRMFEIMKRHPNYLRDYDDSFDSTYAYIEFSVPDKYKDMCKQIAPKEDPKNVHEKFDEEIKNMQNNPDGPEMKRAMALFGPIFEAIEKANNEDDDDKKGPNIKFIGI